MAGDNLIGVVQLGRVIAATCQPAGEQRPEQIASAMTFRIHLTDQNST
jgi:hypothetical protein